MIYLFVNQQPNNDLYNIYLQFRKNAIIKLFQAAYSTILLAVTNAPL